MRLRDFTQATAPWCSAEVLSGRYRLDGLLGSGGAADVHRGFDLRLRRPVAVKVFRPDARIDTEQSLSNEAVILARLHHSGLVTAFDAGQHNGRAFLVMQLIEGSTLRERIASGPLPPQETVALGADLAHALTHAHDAGIVHRDVKPSNILLDAAHRPHLADFGISRLLDATTCTATGTLIGTAAYLSPEQVLGQPVGRPTDIYALGLVLLECLTGRLEYDGGPLEVAIARLHRQPVLPDGLPQPLSRLLRDMTALDEQDRPTARDCARTLTALADTIRAEAGPPALTTRPVVSQEPPQTADHTHVNPVGGRKQYADRSTPARGRTLIAGTTVALAAVMASAFVVTGNSTPQDSDRNAIRATSAPTAKTNTPGNAGQTKPATTSSAARSSDHSTSAALPDDAPGQSVRSASPGPDAESADGPGVHNSAAMTAQTAPRGTSTSASPTPPSGTSTSAAATQGTTATQQPHQPPGQAKKTEVAEDKAEHKKARPTTGER
ncbi:serine/threonine-protein kinase [Streptomyces sp. B1I3]|uniref:serine/threonine-protein kinase n=1 Tax=Streptomyces sp. B1I3 TaxID=3042264 RepID=UPI0027852F95|nr:serine/threonine-protein kinase [Streptomyces sp. B1I3]MDQ0791751.1 serine/threonine protein kinase [Streptomyces sp. B1I3]